MRRLMQNTILALALAVLALYSCKSKTSDTKEQKTIIVDVPTIPDRKMPVGEIIPQLVVSYDKSQSFAVYLPKQYTKDTALPVIIFFDPHGDGTVPLNLYTGLAEDFGFILIGSNNSKNGIDLQQAKAIADNLVNEAESRFNVNKKKITLCGFSGGAKVALAAAVANPAVSTVIYCGAALPVQPHHDLEFLGFAGTGDMNYTDVVSFNEGFKNSQHLHYLVEWKGKHEFPSAEIFKDAFTFIQKGSIDNYSSKQAGITSQDVAKEQARKQELLQAFTTQDINWWKKEIATLNAGKKGNAMNERLLGFISLACYSYANGMLQQNNLAGAQQILTIYSLADPGNKDCEAFTAELKKRKGM
ncbi:MAG TPA: hypothetical protein VK154_14195 [Chitinophagales bacterium]|nr:hypothetical protein [Chitinophagales bacterium]